MLVFTRTKHRAERVVQLLVKAGYRATSLQGNLSQYQRQAVLDGFRTGSFKVLVATDIVARGIDVLDISHVINYDMPGSTDAYIHRIGYTGRVGKTSDAFTFVTNEDTARVRALEHLLKSLLQRRTLQDFDYRVCAPDSKFTRSSREIRRSTVLNEWIGNKKPDCYLEVGLS